MNTNITKSTKLYLLLFVLLFTTCIMFVSSNPYEQESFPTRRLTEDHFFALTGDGIILDQSIQQSTNISLISPSAGSTIRSYFLINVSFDPIPNNIRWRWDSASNWTYFAPTDFVNISVPFSSGTHYLEVSALDNDLVWITRAWAFKVDDNKIFIILNTPEEFSTHQSGTIIEISTDPIPASLLFAWDDNPYSSLLRDLPEEDGIHILHVQAEDNNSVFYQDSFTFYTDDTKPTIQLVDLANNSFIQSWTYFSFTTDSDVDTVCYYWDNPMEIKEIDIDPLVSETTLISTDGSGWHDLGFIVNDTTGNEATYVFSLFTTIRIQLAYPVLSGLTDLVSGNNTVKNSTGTINIQPSSVLVGNFSSTPDAVYYNWWLNDTHRGSNTTNSGVAPASGEHKLTIYANDSHNMWHILDLDVSIDGEIPSITDILYKNNSALIAETDIVFTFSEALHMIKYTWDASQELNNNTIPNTIGKHVLNLTIIDFAFNSKIYNYAYYTKFTVSFSVGNMTSHKGGTSFNASFSIIPEEIRYQWGDESNNTVIQPLPQVSGYHSLNIHTRDTENNWYIDQFLFQTILEVNLSSPIPDYPTTSGGIITLSISESPLTTLYSWDDETWSGILKEIPQEDGNHSFRVWVENSDLPDTQWFLYEFNVIVDNTPPSIVSQTISNNSRINYRTNFSFEYSETCEVSYNWNDTVLWKDNTLLSSGLTDGSFILTINVTDIAGNSILHYYHYVLDLTAISVILNSPTNNSLVNSRSSDVNVTFTESPVSSKYYISWMGSNESEIPSFPFENTSLFILVHVSDGLNWDSCLLNFTTVHYTGRLSGINPGNNSFISTESEISFEWSYSPLRVLWNWNGMSNNTGSCTTPMTEGINRLSVHYQDMNGSYISYFFIFKIDTTTPSVTSALPLNYSIYSNDFDLLNITFDENLSVAYFRWSTEVNWTTYDLNVTELFDFLTIQIPTDVNQNITLSIQVKDQVGNTAYIEYTLVYSSSNNSLGDILLPLSGIAIPVILIAYFKGIRPFLKEE